MDKSDFIVECKGGPMNQSSGYCYDFSHLTEEQWEDLKRFIESGELNKEIKRGKNESN